MLSAVPARCGASMLTQRRQAARPAFQQAPPRQVAVCRALWSNDDNGSDKLAPK